MGGIYLIGGVTAGLGEYITNESKNKEFMAGFAEKGRMSSIMDNFPIFRVDPTIEVGLLGAL